MEYSFSKRSMANLSTCHVRLQALALTVIKKRDCSVIEGFRDEYKQNELYKENLTQLKYPDSLHNHIPSKAIHLVPYPYPEFNSDDPEIKRKAYAEQYYFAGYVMAKAEEIGVDIRWGGDWDRDNNLQNNKFDDLCHFELI